MPFCPKCHDEFQDWVRTCPDCGVDLVAELPAPPEGPRKRSRAELPAPSDQPTKKSEGDPLVRVASASNMPAAHMWAGMFQDKGIRCTVRHLSATSFYRPASDGGQQDPKRFHIYVLQSDAETAREILEEVDPKG